MRIRRKAPKPSRSHPLYILGYGGSSPTPDDIRFWFDLEYGGPLRLQERSGPESKVIMATHGPWSAAIEPLSASDAATWRDAVGWAHSSAAQVLPAGGQTPFRLDQVLHGSRLARGVTLLTQGTAYDVVSQQYFNPSDWQDRRLVQFAVQDHVVVSQAEAPSDHTVEWFFTRGLSKFGVDELETFSPRGLPATPIIETLMDIAGVLIRQSYSLTVGSELSFTELDLTVRIVRHRTASPGGVTLALREIAWSPYSPRP
jgi:hypothetical protein